MNITNLHYAQKVKTKGLTITKIFCLSILTILNTDETFISITNLIFNHSSLTWN